MNMLILCCGISSRVLSHPGKEIVGGTEDYAVKNVMTTRLCLF